MLPLNVPFLPDESYAHFLHDLGASVQAVHFSLYDPVLNDARVRLREQTPETLAAHLAPLTGVTKYLLANGRFQPVDTYMDGDGLRRLVTQLEYLVDAGVLDGLIVADSYLLTALADTAPALAARLEAVPSVNFIIDRVDKLEVLLDLIAGTGFRPPSKIPLDRSLNRRPGALLDLSAAIRRRWPEMKIELLANEGCLDHCPYRSTHEALIAAANTGTKVNTHRLNRDLACMRVLNREPHRILASPFIRPEDMDRYAESADLIKVCGRTLGTAFLQRTVSAYAAGTHSGNLLGLLDAAHWMAGRWEIPNDALPTDLFDTLIGCTREIAGCQHLFDRIARSKPLKLDTFDEIGRPSTGTRQR